MSNESEKYTLINNEILFVNISSENMNFSPKLVIENFEGFNVIRDDILAGGTKQRLLNHVDFFKNKIGECDTLLYTGNYGYGSIFTSILANKLKKKCICAINMTYMNGEKCKNLDKLKMKMSDQTTIKTFDNWRDLVKYGLRIDKYKNIYWMPLGIDFDGVSDLLSYEISRNIDDGVFDKKNIWVVCGVGLLTESLAKAFPSATINSIVITKSLKKRNDITKRTSGYKNVSLIFADNLPINLQTPYPSAEGYDEITWFFAKRYGEKGDYIWNTAS